MEESKDSGEASPISLAEVGEVVKKLLGSKVPCMDEIRLEMLKALVMFELSWLKRLFSVSLSSGTVPV